MLTLDFIIWWYGAGWRELIRRLSALISRIFTTFSVPILLKTLFAPWRRIISYGDQNFIEGLKAVLDNTVSRFVGFSVRIIVLITAILMITAITIVGLIAALTWPLLPIAGIVLIFKGLLL